MDKPAWEYIREGKAPRSEYELGEMTVGIDFLSGFLQDRYLKEYIKEGGSKLKFVTGRKGSGKSHLLYVMEYLAKRESYKTAFFSANDVWLHDFKEIYLETMRQCDIMAVMEDCAKVIIRKMGYEPDDMEEGSTFMDYLSEIGEADPINKRQLRLLIKEMFWDNTRLDNNFALACGLLCGSVLGHPALEEQNRDIILRWLHCDKTVRLLQLRPLGMSPNRINKYNARHMLRSLSEVIHMGSHAGLVVLIDDMEVLLRKNQTEGIRYTKMRRDDTYESIRQLVDEIDSMNNIMFFFGFDRVLMDDESAGLKSYQALWMRIQNEVVGERFNRFSDILDLDRLSAEIYDESALCEMSEKLAWMASENHHAASPIRIEQARELIASSRTNSIGLPLAQNRLTLHTDGGSDEY